MFSKLKSNYFCISLSLDVDVDILKDYIGQIKYVWRDIKQPVL
jgi:hypothetical protein